MNPSEACYALIRQHEGLRLEPYTCPAGKATIGYGHTRNVKLSDPSCTPEQAEAWLREDCEEAARLVRERFTPSLQRPRLTQGQFDALVSFVFNIRRERFTEVHCTLLRWLNAGEPSGQIAEQFDRWVYGRDPETGLAVKLPGLVKRRAAEKALFLS